MLRILGIDPGSRKTGIGIIDYDPSRRYYVHIFSKVLRLDLDNQLPERMGELASQLQSLIIEYKPQQAVLEDVFVGERARAALILGQARGTALAILGLSQIPVLSLSPRKVKQTITGHGHASKFQVSQMITMLLRLDKKPAEDAADALALALSGTFDSSKPQAHSVKQMSSKQKNHALYLLAKAQGKI